jgi:8-oxo-dGTP pyrophosphatase MutT (NUDIX family)
MSPHTLPLRLHAHMGTTAHDEGEHRHSKRPRDEGGVAAIDPTGPHTPCTSGGTDAQTTPPVTKIARHVAPSPGSFAASFVLPIRRDGMALLTVERKGTKQVLGLLGGKTADGENGYMTAAREASEESGCGKAGGAGLSPTTIARIGRGDGVLGAPVEYEKALSVAHAHDLVVPTDADVEKRFPRGGFRTSGKSKTTQLGLKWVPLADLRNNEWRNANMRFDAGVLCARLMHTLVASS